MPVWCAGLVCTAVFRSFLLSLSTHSILHYLCILKVYFHLHFNVHLYCNIFSFPYAIPLHHPFTLPLPQPFPSCRSTLSILSAFPILQLFYFDFSVSLPLSLSPHCPLFFCLIHFTQMGTGFPFQFSATIYPLFYSSNRSFAVIHIAIAFLIYLPRWWRQQLPVDGLCTSSSHYLALHSTRWQFQNLSFRECNRNCGVFSDWRLQHVVPVNQHFRDCIITVVILLIELRHNRNKGDAVGLRTVGLLELPDSAVSPRGF
jgi:hypothetical protein